MTDAPHMLAPYRIGWFFKGEKEVRACLGGRKFITVEEALSAMREDQQNPNMRSTFIHSCVVDLRTREVIKGSTPRTQGLYVTIVTSSATPIKRDS